jgi:lipid-A-disaccharide synthase
MANDLYCVMTLKRLFVITGDASGDVHGSVLIRRLQADMPHLEIEAIGGEHIQQTGIPIFHPQQKLGVFGGKVFTAIPSHYMLGKKLLKHLKDWKPEAVLLIDYGMFNLWMAKQLKQLGIKVFYYIPPQVWASRKGRINTIKRYVDHVFCIFPFEKPLYESYGIPVTFVGHPVVEQLPPAPDKTAFCLTHGLDPDLPIVGIFPGSRKSEIKSLLPVMMKALSLIHQQAGRPVQFLLAKSPAVPEEIFKEAFSPVANIAGQVPFKVLIHENHAILALSQAALVASGTVTLEAALYHTPVVIAYRISRLGRFLFKRFSYVSHIGLPNLLCDDPAGFLPELLSENIRPEDLAEAIKPYLHESPQQATAEYHFTQIQKTLGDAPASLNLVKALSAIMDEPLTEPCLNLG